MKEIERNLKYVKNEIKKEKLSQRIRCQFSKYETIDQLEIVFRFDLESYNVQEFAEAYSAGLYDVNRLRDSWDRDLTPDETLTENDIVTVFDGSNANRVMNMLKCTSENYKRDKRTCIDKDGDEIVSSYRHLLIAQNASAFDSWVVLNSLVKELTECKTIKTAGGFISARGFILMLEDQC